MTPDFRLPKRLEATLLALVAQLPQVATRHMGHQRREAHQVYVAQATLGPVVSQVYEAYVLDQFEALKQR